MLHTTWGVVVQNRFFDWHLITAGVFCKLHFPSSKFQPFPLYLSSSICLSAYLSDSFYLFLSDYWHFWQTLFHHTCDNAWSNTFPNTDCKYSSFESYMYLQWPTLHLPWTRRENAPTRSIFQFRVIYLTADEKLFPWHFPLSVMSYIPCPPIKIVFIGFDGIIWLTHRAL